MKKIRLYCFTYAGGSASVFSKWRTLLDPSVELCAVELAARGRRMREPNYDSIDAAVDDVFRLISPQLPTLPYAFFGHSMGTMIAFELAYKIRENKLPEPVHIFFSGRMAPHLPRHGKKVYHNLPDHQFKTEILELGGTPKEFFDNPELMEVFMPLLKGDFKLTETYDHIQREEPLHCNITVMSGKEDEYTMDEMESWAVHTSKKCVTHYFDGGHFFLNEEPEKVVRIINTAIASELANR